MIKTHFWRTLVFGILGLLTGWLIATLTPKVYEATMELLVGERQIQGGQTIIDPQVQRILEQGTASDTQTELQLLRSQTVFFNAFRNAAVARNQQDSLLPLWVDYFRMYDVVSVEQRANAVDTGGVALVRVKTYNRDFAEDVADEIAKVYNDIRLNNARSSSANAVRYLNAQVIKAKEALDTSEKAYKDFTSANNLVDIGVKLNSLQGQVGTATLSLQQLEQQLNGSRREAELIRSRMNELPATVQGGDFQTIPQRVSFLQQRVAEVKADLASARSRYYDDHPTVARILQQLRQLESQLKAETSGDRLERSTSSTSRNPVREQLQATLATVEGRRDSLEDQVSTARQALEELTNKLNELPGQEGQLRQLQRDLEVADSNYRRVKAQFDEINNRQEVFARGVLVLSEARAFQNSVAPDTAKYVFIGLIAGILVGLVFSFALESFRMRVHNSAQLSDLTGLPVVATVPRLRGASRSVAALAAPGIKPAESFRHMAYTMLTPTADRAVPKLVMFTGVGSVPGRASSTVQFAMAAAAAGKKVLLVDMDPIRGLVTKAFGAEGRPGVSDIFERNTLSPESSELFVPTVHDNLVLLPTGADTARTLADRTTDQVEAFVKFISDKYDLVVLDTPPCDLFADASRIAALVDEISLVVSASQTNYQSIPSGYDLLARAGAKSVNLVLTDASPKDEPFADSRNYRRTA